MVFEDLIGNKKIQRQAHVDGVCPQCNNKHAWIYPKDKTKVVILVCFYCPDCGHRWVINV